MAEEFEKKFIRPIINASYPGTLAGLSLATSQVAGGTVHALPPFLEYTLLLGALMFLFSAFFIFFYTIYPTRKKLWTGTAITFLVGLSWLILSVFLLFIVV